MDGDRIKELLHAWRPGQEAGEETARALAAARNDPELAQWLDREQAFDAAFAAKLGEVSAPADLLERILQSVEHEKVVAFRPTAVQSARRHWRRYGLGIAASIMLIAGIFTLGLRVGQNNASGQFENLAGFVSFSVQQAMQQPMSDVEGPQSLRQLLVAQDSPVPEHIPDCLGQYRPKFAGTITVNGSRASVIGYESDAGYTLMVFNRSCLGSRGNKLASPILYDLGDRMAAAWIDGSQVFVLVSDRRGEATMRLIHGI